MTALPVIEALIAPLMGLLVAALLPFATARLLCWVYLTDLPDSGDARFRRLVPFRRAALFAGLAQIQLAWTLGVTRLGPTLVDEPGGALSLAFGALLAAVTFAAGGVARRVEEPARTRRSVKSAISLRMRLVPFLAAPVAVGIAAAHLPLIAVESDRSEVSYAFAALAFAMCFVAVAYGGVLLSVMTRALCRADDALALRVETAAAREGIDRVFTLCLPTGDARFVNAAALPWARTVVVSEAAVTHLESDELDAVLAHEAAHLSEGPMVSLCRLAAAALFLFALMPGLTLAFGIGFERAGFVFAVLALTAVVALRYARRLARRMEVRADARAAAHLGGAPLARALRRIAVIGQRPMTAGGARVHPGLWDRLLALGDDPGPRPEPLARSAGLLLGLALLLSIVGGSIALHILTDVPPEAIHGLSASAAKSRLRLDPWDGEAMLALGWRAREDGALEVARARAEAAGQMGADPKSYYLLWSELAAADGDCEAARASFEASLAAEAETAFDDGPFGNLSLGNYTLPPTLITDCEMTIGEAFGEDAIDEEGNAVLGGRRN